MTNFRCHKCRKEFKKTGYCPECGTALVKNCPVCGEEIDQCTCTSSMPQTKGPGKH